MLIRARRHLVLSMIAASGGAMLPVHAQPAADPASVLPQRVFAYCGSSGAEAVKVPFAGTSLARLLGEPDVRDLLTGAVPPLLELARQQLEGGLKLPAELREPAGLLLNHMMARPWAVALIDFNPASAADPIAAAFVTPMGDANSELRRGWEVLVAAMSKSGGRPEPAAGAAGWTRIPAGAAAPPLAFCIEKDFFILALGADAPKAIRAVLDGGPSLAVYDEFRAVQRSLNVDFRSCPLAFYADAARLRFRMLRPGGMGDPAASMMVTAALQMLGLQRITGLGAALGFSDADLRYALALRDGGVRRGAWRAFAQRPIEDRDLHCVPADASAFYATHLDLKGFVEGLFDGVTASGPAAPPPADSPFAALMQAPPVRLIAERLAPALGDAWVVSDSTANGGIAVTGLALCIEVKDAVRARQAVGELMRMIATEADASDAKVRTVRDGRFEFDMLEVKAPEMPFAPAWGVADRWLVIALYPPMVRSMMAHLSAAGAAERSILSNARFAARRATLPKQVQSLLFIDPAAILGMAYDVALPALTAAATELQAEGVTMDVARLPTRETLLRHIRPTIGWTTADDAAVMLEARASLPLITPSVPEVAVLAPLASLALAPALTGGSVDSQRQEGLSVIRQCGAAMLAHARDHNGAWPKSMDDVLPAMAAGGRPPGMSRERLADVVLVEGLPPLSRIAAVTECVIAYERPSRHGGAGTLACFADGSARWRTAKEFEMDLARTQAAILAGRTASSPAAAP